MDNEISRNVGPGRRWGGLVQGSRYGNEGSVGTPEGKGELRRRRRQDPRPSFKTLAKFPLLLGSALTCSLPSSSDLRHNYPRHKMTLSMSMR